MCGFHVVWQHFLTRRTPGRQRAQPYRIAHASGDRHFFRDEVTDVVPAVLLRPEEALIPSSVICTELAAEQAGGFLVID